MSLTIDSVQRELIAKANISNFSRTSEFDVSDFFYSSFIFKNLTDKKQICEFSMAGVLKIDAKTFIDKLIQLTQTRIVYESHEFDYKNYTLTSDLLDSFIHVTMSDERHTINIYCNGPEKLAILKKFVFSNFQSKRNNDNVYAISRTPKGGLDLMSLGKLEYKLESNNYDEETIEEYSRIVAEFSSKTPKGRLVIFNGKPGVGKSHLVRGVLSELKNNLIIILPSRFTGEIDGPELMQLIISERKNRYGILNEDMDNLASKERKEKQNAPFTFLIEDADSCLVPRGADNMSTISSLLNYTDGIFGSMMDIRIIATTNAESIDFDPALTRPGRLCSHVYLSLLKPEKASEIYLRLSGKEKTYDSEVSLAQVYEDAYGAKTKNSKSKKQVVGFGV